ncbi:MAG: hypothetical protein HY273_16425 [Gammaproteobacteria bacterium]|nr:hypothetical protein [Gammaproteobacteria bacterium]
MYKSNFVLVLGGAVVLLTGCADFAIPKRTDGVSSSTGTVRAARSTKHASTTPPNVLGGTTSSKEPSSKEKNEPKGNGSTKLASKSAATPDDADIRDVVAMVGAGGSTQRSFANEDVVSVNSSKTARQPVIDLDQLNTAPHPPRTGSLIPDRPRVYAFGPTKPGYMLADVAGQLLPSERVTIAQMMWALYRKNPDAFVNNDINSLKPRSLLNVPELDELMAITRAEAETQITRLHGSLKTKVSASY